MRVSHDVLTNVAYFNQFSFNVARLSYDIRTSVAKISNFKFAKISRRQVRDTRTNVVRLSHDRRATVLRNIQLAKKKNRINFLNMFKTFAISSRLVRANENSHDTRATLARMSCESQRQNKQNSREKIAMPWRY